MKKKESVLALLSGICLVLVFPLPSLEFLAWFCLLPLLAAMQNSTPGNGFKLGWLAGSVYHCGLIYWVTVSMSLYGGLPGYVSMVLMVLFAVFLGLFIALPVYCSCRTAQKSGVDPLVTLPFFWTATEHLKSWLLTGFPWELLGYSQYRTLPVIQFADITGVYGISFLIVLVNCTVMAVLGRLMRKRRFPLLQTASTVALLAAVLIYGFNRLDRFEKPEGPVLKLTIVQPNIPQDLKWDPSFLAPTMEIFTRLTRAATPQQPDLIVWPESATPFFFEMEESFRQTVAALVGETGTPLLLGSPSYSVQQGVAHYYNSAYLISPENEILGKYDKLHLVPYGEYVPLQQFFPYINKMVAGIGDFRPGDRVKTLALPDCPFGTVICYEIIFPNLVRRFAAQGARFLVNITNDAWFGPTSAPYQHLSMAVLRAVENRRYIARSANTGISACIAPTGVITAQTKLFTQTTLPAMIYCYDLKTVYTRYGDVFAWICYAASLVFLFCARTRKNRSRMPES